MKNILNIRIVLLLSFLPSFLPSLHSTVTLGSGAGIPVLHSGNLHSLFSVSGGTITEDIVIRGDLEILNLGSITFSGISINGFNNNDIGDLLFTEVSQMIFSNCVINAGNIMTFDASFVRFTGVTIDSWLAVQLTNTSVVTVVANSVIRDVFRVEVNSMSYFNGHTTDFDNSPIVIEGFGSVALQYCDIRNAFAGAVSFRGGGYYTGRKNLFEDNIHAIETVNHNLEFIRFEEEESTFTGHISNTIELDNVSEIIIADITISDAGGFGLRIRGGNGATHLVNNVITGDGNMISGISVSNRRNAYVASNEIDGIGPGGVGSDPIALRFNMVQNLSLLSNKVEDDGDANGVLVQGCPDALIDYNRVDGAIIGIEVLDSYGVVIEDSDCENSTDAGIVLRNSLYATLCNNTVDSGEDGIRLESTNMMLEMADNHFLSNARGLVYAQDVMANAQVEKGNDFTSNTLGAEFEDVTDLGAIFAMRYVVKNISAEYPSHSPANWFVNTGTSSLMCDIPVAQGPDIERMFEGLEDSPLTGKVINDVMLGLDIIVQEGLEEEEELEDYWNTYGGSDLDLLPLIKDLNSYHEYFEETTPVIGLDTFGTLTNISAHLEYLEDMDEVYSEAIADEYTSISSLISTVGGLTLVTAYEDDYQYAIGELLGLMLGDTLSSADTTDIINLAEGCIADDGPAIYIAQVIAGWLDLEYTRATSCTPVTPRSSRPTEYLDQEKIEVFPNPASKELMLSLAVEAKMADVFNSIGMPVGSVLMKNGNKLDVESLPPGVYFLQIKGVSDVLRFVKI